MPHKPPAGGLSHASALQDSRGEPCPLGIQSPYRDVVIVHDSLAFFSDKTSITQRSFPWLRILTHLSTPAGEHSLLIHGVPRVRRHRTLFSSPISKQFFLSRINSPPEEKNKQLHTIFY